MSTAQRQNIAPRISSTIGKYQDTPFHFVAYHGLSDVADFMLEELQDHCNSKNVNDKTPMNYAVKCGHPEIIRSMKQKLGLDNDEIVVYLHAALKNGDFKCVKALLEDQDLESRKQIARIVYFCETALQAATSYYKKTPRCRKGKIFADCRIPILKKDSNYC